MTTVVIHAQNQRKSMIMEFGIVINVIMIYAWNVQNEVIDSLVITYINHLALSSTRSE